MLIKGFTYIDLNGFLTNELSFNEDVSFLHGINGSGKTTILKAITSILTPDIYWLTSASYELLELEIIHEGDEYNIAISKAENGNVNLSLYGSNRLSGQLAANEVASALNATNKPKYIGLISVHASDQNFEERAIIEKNPVLSFIKKLPSPIFMGLDRTTVLSGAISYKSFDAMTATIMPKNYKTALDEALDQAVEVVLRRMSSISAERNKLYADTQTKLILSLFDYKAKAENEEIIDAFNFSESDVNEIKKMQSHVISGLKKIKITNNEIEKLVIPFFKEIEVRARAANLAIENRKKHEKSKSTIKFDGEHFMEALNAWFSIQPYLSLVNLTLEILRNANDLENKTVAVITNYKNTIDSFLKDSGKTLAIGEDHLNISLPNGKNESIKILSSGERQIFVLITHLAMNPEMQKANVLIIDEPELSLHLKWQKQFVKSVQKVSPKTQIILATHSPEIINRMTSKTISLGR